MSTSHTPVMLQEFLELYKTKKLRVFFDGTLGAGGHAKALLMDHPEIEVFIGTDRDLSAIEIAKKTLKDWERKVKFMHATFDCIQDILKIEKISCVDGIFLDLGISSMQVDQAERGFSFRKEAPLDMRMDSKSRLNAKEIVNRFTEKKIGEILRDFGEEPKWRKISKAIVQARRNKPIETTTELAAIIESVKPRYGKLHPATLCFQGLRIYVNEELIILEKGLPKALGCLCPKGTMGVMSFHRLEDRLVKVAFQQSARDKDSPYGLVYKKPLVPTRQEAKKNPRSRSTKFRAIERGEMQ